MNSGIGDFARCLVGGIRRGTRKPYGTRKRLLRRLTRKVHDWRGFVQSGKRDLVGKWSWRVEDSGYCQSGSRRSCARILVAKKYEAIYPST